MARENSIYGLCSLLIEEAEENQKVAIKVNDISTSILNSTAMDMLSRDELADRYAKALTAVCLYQKGYRSVVRGHGYYVNAENCTNPDYIARFLNNAKGSETEKSEVVKAITQKFKSLPEYGQYRFDIDGNIIEEITQDKLLEMLEDDAITNM